jgi:hypothetical protein
MKKYMLYLPALVLAVFSALWLRQGSGESATLQAAIATQRATLAPPLRPDDRAALAAQDEARTLMGRNAAASAELQRIEEATSGIQKETAALQKQIPPSLDTEITESFGRITDMGAEFGKYCRLLSAGLEASGQKDNEFNKSIVNAFMKFATWAPEMSAFEDTPAEIASLQSAALRETFALNDTQTQQAEAIIKAHFAVMKAAGLTHSSHDAPEWQERRSASLTQLLWKLRPLIPANSKQTPILTQIVNIGAGTVNVSMDAVTEVSPATGTSESRIVQVQGFPNWPAVPWLPTTPNK